MASVGDRERVWSTFSERFVVSGVAGILGNEAQPLVPFLRSQPYLQNAWKRELAGCHSNHGSDSAIHVSKSIETKRIDFTDFFLRFRPAEDAHAAYKHFFISHQQLIKLLIEHPAMKPNLQQTFSTPANSKNKVYFMWDFVLRTFQFLAALVNPQNPWKTPDHWDDIFSRSMQAKMLTIDNNGTLKGMNASVGYNDDGGVSFTEEIKAAATKLVDLPAYCEGCGKANREDGGALLQCAKCKQARYCSAECQKSCWKKHKRECQAS